MGGGTDIALETADAAVLHGRVLDIARLVALSRRTMGNIRQNVTIALGLKAVFLITTIAGVTGLWPAILADTGATRARDGQRHAPAGLGPLRSIVGCKLSEALFLERSFHYPLRDQVQARAEQSGISV